MAAEPLKGTPLIFLFVANTVAVSARTAVAGLKALPPTKYPPETLTSPVIFNLYVVVTVFPMDTFPFELLITIKSVPLASELLLNRSSLFVASFPFITIEQP